MLLIKFLVFVGGINFASIKLEKHGRMELQTNHLYAKIAELIASARQSIVSVVNLTMVHTYFEIGKMIVEEEQGGKERAAYGKQVLKDLSERLTSRFGKGFSVDNLQNMRNFYTQYSIYENDSRKFSLSWSHYLFLMRIDNVGARHFYEIESSNNHWKLHELKRQFNSALHERLALSRDKAAVKALASKGQVIQMPQDVIKDPYILEWASGAIQEK